MLNGWFFNYAVPSDRKTTGNVELYNINIVSCSSKFFFCISVIIKSYRGQEISLFSRPFKLSLGPTHSLVKRYRVSFPEVKRPWGVKLNTHLHLVAILPLCSMTWARAPLPLPFLYTHEIQAITATSQFPTSELLA